MKKFILILLIMALSIPAFGGVTLYNNYNRQSSPWTIQADPQFVYIEYTYADNPPGWSIVTPSGFPSGNSLFDTALDVNPDSESFVLCYTNDTSTRAINNTLNPTEGTIEMWIAPHWSGTNQGGSGPGLAPGESMNLFCWGASELGGPLNIIFFNNGYPDDGGQLFLSFKNDATDFWNMNSSALQPAPPPSDTNGTVEDWVAGEWHHVAASWDATTVGLYLDGKTVREETRTQPVNLDMFGNGGYLYCRNRGAGYPGDEVINVWDGMVDDFLVSDYAKYTSTVGGPVLPTGPNVTPGPEIYQAWNPSPASPSTVYRLDGATLSWNAGTDAVTHKVYWSDIESNVTSRVITPITLSAGTETTATPVTPSIDTTYYWAVDEVNSLGGTAAGELWAYETGGWIFVDDMEDYDLSGETDTGNQIYDTWVDGYYGTSGSAVAAQPDPFVGDKAMEFKYSNNGTSPYGPTGYPYYSEIAADTSNLECGSDWTAEGVKALLVHFKGEPANDETQRMYIVIEDSTPNTAMVQYGLPDSYSTTYAPYAPEDMNNIKLTTWQYWAIDLRSFNGVNLADVQKVYIGFGERGNTTTPGGSGTVMIDDIGLILPIQVTTPVIPPGDVNGDSVVDFKDVAVVANDWAVVGYDGIWPIY